jgi:hypothetical protein
MRNICGVMYCGVRPAISCEEMYTEFQNIQQMV